MTIGRDAVDWAVHQAKSIAAANITAFPHAGGGSAQLDTLRLGVESATLMVLECLHEGRMVGLSLPKEAESQVRDFVHRKISLTDQWAMIRQGHASLVQQLMTTCIRLAPLEEQSRQLLQVTQVAFDFVENFTGEVARVYETEQQRLAESSDASRDAALSTLLHGTPTDLADLGLRLRYDIEFRWHIALVFTRDTPGPWDDLLTRAARQAVRAAGATQVLLVPQGHAILWAFGNSTLAFDQAPDWSDAPSSVHIAVGGPGWGLEGLRDSHERAIEAQRIAAYLPTPGPVTHYRDINLFSLLLTDGRLLKDFIADELGELALNSPGTTELRRTLATYLDSHNTQATAASMFVARNTVTYRLRKAEALLGHSLSERQLEMRVALYLSQLDHPQG
ncbi:PucR family transcriptional regulator [Streptomyces umbrinus]